MRRKTVITNDGSHSLLIPEMNEYYHSSWGAITESMQVFIKAGFREIQKKEPRIFEMGFGTGLNALLTLNEIQNSTQKIHYTAVEKYPLDLQEVRTLNYVELVDGNLKNDFMLMHDSPMNQTITISDRFILKKIHTDIRDFVITEKFDLIFYDAFAPDKQPELWGKTIFKKLIGALNDNGIITTYAAKGAVRRCWQVLGLKVEKMPGPPGKREFLRGRKIL